MMSVPLTQRGVSPMQYIATAQSIYDKAVSICLRLPKRLRPMYGDDFVKEALALHRDVVLANEIKVETQSDYEKRRSLLQEAVGLVVHISALLDNLVSLRPLRDGGTNGTTGKPAVTRNAQETMYGFCSKERALIDGVLKKDKKSYETRAKEGKMEVGES